MLSADFSLFVVTTGRDISIHTASETSRGKRSFLSLHLPAAYTLLDFRIAIGLRLEWQPYPPSCA